MGLKVYQFTQRRRLRHNARMTTTNRSLKTGFGILGAFSLLLLGGGCTTSVDTGLRMEGNRIAFIKAGITERSEVMETLGAPLFEFKEDRTIAYYWETSLAYSYSGGFGLGSGKVSTHCRRWLFCVHFDENNKVDRFGNTQQLESETPKAAAIRWLENKL